MRTEVQCADLSWPAVVAELLDFIRQGRPSHALEKERLDSPVPRSPARLIVSREKLTDYIPSSTLI
jgi:hypothetical protein